MSESNNESNKSTYSSIKFFVAEQMLIASFSPDSLDSPLDERTVIQLLESSGYGRHSLEDESLLNLVENSENNYQGDIPLEKHTDASFELKIDKDVMSASLVIKRAHGGEDLNFDDVLESILEEPSIHEDYLDRELLAQCLTTTQDEPAIIATGIAPINGEDSKFEVLFNTETLTGPKSCSDGSINHYETHEYITVKDSQAVMKRIPHTKGTAGHNILGEQIAAENGKVIKFTLDKTVTVDNDDPNILLAAKKGHPIASDYGVHIDDTLTVKNASLSSGNIHFDGSVEVTGEVFTNVTIEASGDIFIHGMVENASLISGNNITIGAGILSRVLYDHNSDADFIPECTLVAEGTIIAKYCNTVCATAKKDILIETYSMHSQLNAGDYLVFGNNNGKGVVIGGNNSGNLGVTANVIGSDAYVRTDVTCGSLKQMKKTKKELQSIIVRSNKELLLLNELLNKIKKSGSPTKVGKVKLQKAKKLYKEIENLKQYIEQSKAKLRPIKKELKLTKNANIKVLKKLYPNIHITINDINAINNREHEQSTISCENYEIQYD